MPTITFVDQDGREFTTEADVGHSLMEIARTADVPGITADCGGACSCATCHVYIADEWRDRVGPPSVLEADMLEVASNVTEASRLSCQVMVTEALDGLVCKVASN